nr:feruloyl CoA ortho-hydroxylase 1-like [Tanacetum cinerariifolium]
MAPSISITNTESLNIKDFVVNKGHGVKGLAELGLKALPHQYIQPPQERFDSSNEEPNQDSIPVIDMSNWDDPNVAKAICDAASKWGFFQIVNHGVPIHVFDDVKDATRKFFALPAEEKLKYSKEKSVTSNIRFGTSFTPEAEKALEWKDYLSLFFVSDDEAETLWPSACSNEEPNQDSIPVIDMSNGDDPNVAKAICDAASKWGFFQIVNHGVPIHVLDDVKDATRKFFALPAEEKLKYSKEKSVTNNIRFGTSFTPEAEKALEWKDYLSLFLVSDDEAATLWPSVCRNQALEYIKSSKLVVKKLLMILLNGLNLKEIDEAKESKLMGSKRINLNYYPKCPNPELTVGVGRHSDVSTLTILLQDEIGGLYVRNLDTMKWIHVPPVEGSLVINVGDALQIISNGKYKSVEHRVSANGSSNRISVPIFVNPRPSDVIGPLQELVDSGEKPLYKNVIYSDYVKHFFRKAHDGKATIDFAKF